MTIYELGNIGIIYWVIPTSEVYKHGLWLIPIVFNISYFSVMYNQNHCGFKLWVSCSYPPQLQCIPQKSCVWLRSMHLPSFQMDGKCMLLTYSIVQSYLFIILNPFTFCIANKQYSSLALGWFFLFVIDRLYIFQVGKLDWTEMKEIAWFCLTCFGAPSI